MALNGPLGLGIVLSAKDLASGPLSKVDRAFRTLDGDVERGAVRMQSSFGGITQGILSFASGALASFGALEVLGAAGEFEEAMAKVDFVSRATADEMEQLKQAALDAGMATQFSPIQAAGGLLTFAKAGYSAKESLDLLVPTLDLAAASFDELTPESAAGVATQALKEFGLDAKDGRNAIDHMTLAVSSFALRAGELPRALGVASRGAQAMNQSLGETLISLGLTRDAMPRVQQAASAVAVAMAQLANPRAQQRLAGLGIAITDARGHFRNFLDVIGDLAPRLDRMSEPRRASVLLSVFGMRGMSGVEAILSQLNHGIRDANGQVLRGAAAIAYLRDQFANAGGAAARLRETMLDTFAGQKRKLVASLKTLAIVLGTAFVQVLTPVLRALTSLVNLLTRALLSVPEPVRRVLAAIVLGVVGMAAFGAAVLVVKRGLVLLRAGLTLARLAIVDFLVELGPITLVIAVVAAVVAGFVIAYRKNFGGLADMTHRFVHEVTLGFRALAQLFSSGEFSGAVMAEIDKAENTGLKQFVITIYMLGYRLERLWDGIKEGFVSAIEAARPAFEALGAAFRELGDEIAGLVGDLTGSAAQLPSQQFLSFGQIVGTVLGTIVGWLVTVFGWVVRLTSGVVAGFRAMEEYMGPAFKILGAALADLRDAFEELFGIESYGSDQAVTLGDVFRTLGEVIGYVLGGAVAAITIALAVLAKTLEYIIDVVRVVKDAIVWLAHAIGDAASSVSGFFSGLLGVVTGVVQSIVTVFTTIYALIAKVVGLIKDAIESLIGLLKKAAGMVTGLLGDIWGGVKGIGGAIEDAGSYVGGKVGDAAGAVGGFVSDGASSIWDHAKGLASDVLGGGSSSPSAADAEREAKFIQTLGQIAGKASGIPTPPTTVNVQLHVDGEVLARTTVKALEDDARRGFAAIPIFGS